MFHCYFDYFSRPIHKNFHKDCCYKLFFAKLFNKTLWRLYVSVAHLIIIFKVLQTPSHWTNNQLTIYVKHCFDTCFVFNHIQFMLINKHLQRSSLKSKTYHSLYTLLNQPGQEFSTWSMKTQRTLHKKIVLNLLINKYQPTRAIALIAEYPFKIWWWKVFYIFWLWLIVVPFLPPFLENFGCSCFGDSSHVRLGHFLQK